MNGTTNICRTTGLCERPTVFSSCDLIEVLSKLKGGIGLGAIHTKHIQFLFEENLSRSSDLLRLRFKNGHVPPRMWKGAVRLIMKQQFGVILGCNEHGEVKSTTFTRKVHLDKSFSVGLWSASHHFASSNPLEEHVSKYTSVCMLLTTEQTLWSSQPCDINWQTSRFSCSISLFEYSGLCFL